MNALSASEARANLYRLMDEAASSHKPVLISGKRNNAVLIAEDDWSAIQETLHLLSVPGMRGIVPRHTRLHYTGFDQYGQPIDRLVSGFHARVVQHECDHLIGKLYPMRVRDFTKFGYTKVLFPGLDETADD